ncbi:MAG: conjugal transfer protein TraF [Planctomycetota bacterium]|nr:conjugal transfer protein TraF [Planctomycetota bacterium]
MSQPLPGVIGASRVLCWCCLLLLISPQLSGQAGLDPRSMAMGGTGVAVANPATAAFFNPAVLSIEEQRRFSVEYPIIGARYSDPDDLFGKLSAYQDQNLFSNLQNSINTFNLSPSEASSSTVISDLSSLNSALSDIDGNAIVLDLLGAGSVGYSGQDSTSQYRWQAYMLAGGRSGGVISYQDGEFFSGFLAAVDQVDFDNLANNTPAQLDALANYLTYTVDGVTGEVTGVELLPPSTPQSSLDFRSLGKQEVGVAISTRIGGYAVGVTPKFTRIELLDYSASSEAASESSYDQDDFTTEYEDFNLDLGIAQQLENGWTLGLTARNLIAHEYAGHRRDPVSGVVSPTGNSIDVTPSVHLGMARQEEWWTVAVDLDLIAQEGVLPQLPGEQYLSTGVELDLAGWGQLRGGYRLNLDDSIRNVASAGIGVSPFGIHLDVGVAGNQNELGLAVQLGFRF